MSAASDIRAKFEELRSRGLDLGAEQGPEQDAGFGGRVQVYQHGRIYWHPNAGGAHEVHGGILTKYLSLGGPGTNPATGRRDFGFPTTDETRTSDGLYPVSHFEFGSIIWKEEVAGAGVGISGDFRAHWENLNSMRRPEQWGSVLATLGYPISDPIQTHTAGGGEVVYFERGCLWRGQATNNIIIRSELSRLPPLCRPSLINPDSTADMRLKDFVQWGIPKAIFDANKSALRSVTNDLWQGRLFLRRVTSGGVPRPEIQLTRLTGSEGVVGQNVGISLTFTPSPSNSEGPTPLEERALYDVIFRPFAPDGNTLVLAPHAYYVKRSWENFGFIHATDLHVGRRIDGFQLRLRQLGLQEAAEQFSNCNDNFRNLVRQMNFLHDGGQIDFVMATGDLVDYVFEEGDNRLAGGNFQLLEQLILGQSPFTDGTAPEELRVPIFTTLGNHDYRPNPYTMDFDVGVSIEAGDFVPFMSQFLDVLEELTGEDVDPDVGFVRLKKEGVHNSKSLNLTHAEATALQNGQVPQLDVSFSPSREEFLRQVTPDIFNQSGSLNYYLERLVGLGRAAAGSQYTVRLGPRHRIVMLDTGWDLGIPGGADLNNFLSLLLEYLGGLSEDRAILLGGAPNQLGVTNEHLSEVRIALQEAHGTDGVDRGGLVFVGMHGPPFYPKGSELPHYFRETEHPTAPPEEMKGYLIRCIGPPPIERDEFLEWKAQLETLQQHWMLTGTPHFKRGSIAELLDSGIAKGKVEEFLKLCVGERAAGKVDLVLCGHHHDRAEFRLGTRLTDDVSGDTELFYHMDFYTENPAEYYRSIKNEFGRRKPVHILVKGRAAPNGAVVVQHDNNEGAVWRQWLSLDVPPRSVPLSQATDFRDWWNRHRPLVTQTGPLGPVGQNTRKDLNTNATKPGPDFQGVRWISVRNDVISRISYASLADLDELIAQGGVLDVDPSEGATTITHVHHMGTFGVVRPTDEGA